MTSLDFKTIQTRTFFAVLIGMTLLFLWMLRAYLYPLFWAAVLAAMFNWLQTRLRRQLHNASLAAVLTEIIILLILFIPLAGIISLLIQQAVTVYYTFGNRETFIAFNAYVQQALSHPVLSQYVGQIDLTDQLSNLGQTASTVLYNFIKSSGQNTARMVVQFFIMLYTLYYFLKDGANFLKKLMHLLPLGDVYEERLYARFVSTTRATLKGSVVIGIVQGTLGALGMFIAGVPAALFWGVIMVLLSIIPGVGISLVLIPVAVVLLIQGLWWQAVVVLVAAIIGGSIDNLMRGPLVGKDTQMHPLFVFFGTIGGILTFGVTGILIGPIITAMLLSIWQIYEEKYHSDLVKAG